MQLQTSVSRRLGGKKYVKHVVVIPNTIIAQSGWNTGDQIEAKITKKGILLRRTEVPCNIRKPDYDQFRKAIVSLLTTYPRGFSWSELRAKIGLEQTTPGPMWVKRMEEESGLERIRDKKSSQVIWRLLPEYFAQANLSTLNDWTGKPRH